MTTTSDASIRSAPAWRSDAFLVAALPFIGSLVALVFEAGFLSFFDVPLVFTQIDFVRVAIATCFVGSFVAVLVGAFTALAAFTQHSHPVRRALLYPLVVAFFFGPILYFMPAAAEHWWIFAALLALLVLSYLLPPLFSRRLDKKYLQRLEEALEEERSLATDHQVQRPIAHAISQRLLAPLGGLMLGVFYVLSLGRDYAANRTVHYVLRDSPD